LTGPAALSVESATTFATPGIESGLDHVLGPDDVGLDAFEGVVFGRRDLFQGGGVDDDVDALDGPAEPVEIPDVADEVAQLAELFRRELLGHLVLLEFVAGKDHQAFYFRVAFQHRGDEFFSKRTGPAGYQNRTFFEQDAIPENL